MSDNCCFAGMSRYPLTCPWHPLAENRPDDEPCVCDTDFTCVADEHDKGRCDACEAPGIYALCCVEHQAQMCSSCANANHGGEA